MDQLNSGDFYQRIGVAAVKAIGRPYRRILVHAHQFPDGGPDAVALIILFTGTADDIVESYAGPGNSLVLDEIDALRSYLKTSSEGLWTIMNLVIDGTSFNVDLSYETGDALDLPLWENSLELKKKFFNQDP